MEDEQPKEPRKEPDKDQTNIQPIDLLLKQLGKPVINRLKSKITYKIWEHSGTEWIQVSQGQISLSQNSFRVEYKDGFLGFKKLVHEYHVNLARIQWAKTGRNRSMVLNYEYGKSAPIDFNPPEYYLDARIGAELHRRKAFVSLLNKIDTYIMVALIFLAIATVAALILNIYTQTEKAKVERTLLVTQNSLDASNKEIETLKTTIDRLENPPIIDPNIPPPIGQPRGR